MSVRAAAPCDEHKFEPEGIGLGNHLGDDLLRRHGDGEGCDSLPASFAEVDGPDAAVAELLRICNTAHMLFRKIVALYDRYVACNAHSASSLLFLGLQNEGQSSLSDKNPASARAAEVQSNHGFGNGYRKISEPAKKLFQNGTASNLRYNGRLIGPEIDLAREVA